MRYDTPPSWPAGDGEMAGLIRSHDWGATPLGPVATWPTSLRVATRLMLTTQHPMFLWWGPELIQLYNDAYRGTMGPEKHPAALGGRGRDTWEGIWGAIGPQVEEVMRGGAATWPEDQLVAVTRRGSREDVWWTYSFSPIDDEGAPDGVGGVMVICRDVTREHLARAAALDSEARYRAFVTASSDVIYRMSPDWSVMQRLEGVGFLADTSEPRAGWLEDYIHPDDRPAVQDAIRHAIAARSQFELEHRVRRLDGTLGWTLSRAVPILSEGGEVAEWLGAARDITVRKEAEAALRDSEARYQALFAASPVPFMVLAPNAPDFTVTAANEAYFAATLTTPDTLIGRRLFDVFTDDPSRPGMLGSEALALSLDRVLSSRRTDAMDRVRYDLATPDGGFAPHWWEAINAPMLDAGGEVSAIIHQVTRVTGLHLAEAADQEHRARQAFLLELADAFRPLTDPVAVQTAAMRLLAERLDASRAGYFEVEEDGDAFHLGGRSERGAKPMPERMRLSGFPPALGAAYRSGRTVTVPDVGVGGEFVDGPDPYLSLGVRAWAAVPLLRGGRLAAWISVHSRTPRRWSAVDLQVLRDAAERTWGASERARAETALNESEALFRTLSETAPALIWRNDARGENVFVNRRFTEYTGRSAAEIRGGSWRALVHPDDEEAYVAGYLEAVEGQRAWQSRNRIRRRDGAWRWFENYAQPLFDEGGRYAGHVGISADVTDMVLAERALRDGEEQRRLATELVPALLWQADPAGREIVNTDRWKLYTGQSSADVQRHGWLDAVHPDDREATRAAFAHAFATGEPIERQQRIHQAGNGYRWHLVRHLPVRDGRGTILRWYGAAIDIHELRELQGRQQVMVAELQHRTRNLITVVQSLSERTLDEATSFDDFAERFERRLSALSRVQGLLSHLSAGDRVFFDELLRSELAALGAPDGRTVLDGPAGVPLRSATVQTFALALHELATNAVKYGALSPAGGRLRVAWRVVPATGGAEATLRVDWRESGVAMPPVGAPARGGGYGRELIEQALPYQLKAKTRYALGPDGVECTIAVPIPAAPAEEDRPA